MFFKRTRERCRVTSAVPKKIAVVVATPMTAQVFLRHQLGSLAEEYHVTLIANLDLGGEHLELPDSVTVVSAPIVRNINLMADIRALFLLYRLFRNSGFVLVHSVTPKAGLLTMLAGKFSGVNNRLHTFTGQVWVTRKGLSRFLLRSLDKLVARLATQVLADSASQCEFLVESEVVKPGKVITLCDGSISGVDINRFAPSPAVRKEVRVRLKIPNNSIVLTFLGRMKRDKGIVELASAFAKARLQVPSLVLLLVGPDEDEMLASLEEYFSSNDPNVHYEPYTNSPERYMVAADLFCMPSYREGFGTVIIEAAACGVPAIASRIYGLTDAIADNETGLLVEPRETSGLVNAIVRLATNDEERMKKGAAARERAVKLFSQQRLTDALIELYGKIIGG